MEEENKFKKVRTEEKAPRKSRACSIIFIIILLAIIGLFIASFFVKDSDNVLYIDRIKKLIVKGTEDTKDTEEEVTKYKVEDYLKIEERLGSNENFKYEYIVWTDKLPKELYKDFKDNMDVFIDKEKDSEFEKKELKTHAEIFEDILYVNTVERYYVKDMPIIAQINSFNVDLTNNTKVSDNEIISKYDYNPIGIYTKVLENILETTKAEKYYLEDEVTVVSKQEFEKNIVAYAQSLTDVQDRVVTFFVKDGKLFAGFIETSILDFLNLTFDKGQIDGTERSIELAIVK